MRLRIAPLGMVAVLGSGFSTQAGSQPVGDVQADLRAVAAKYGIAIVQSAWKFPGRITGAAATAGEVAAYARLFVDEFGLYPPELVRKTGLERVVMCKDLAFDGQLRGAIPDFGNNTLYLDVLRGRNAERYVRGVIHHEFFHIIDWRDDGVLYGDDKWKGLNPKGFRYGSGGVAAQGNSSASVLTDRLPGFLTSYATSGVEEDKAEMFRFLMIDPSVVAARAKEDAVVATEVVRIKELLAKFCPELDAKFWRRIEARDRPASAPATRKIREPARR